MAFFQHPSGQLTLLPPPDDYRSNFETPQRQYINELYWGSGVFNFLTVLFVFQRFYAHLRLQRRFLPEDGLLLLAWVGLLAPQLTLVADPMTFQFLIIAETVLILRRFHLYGQKRPGFKLILAI